MTINCKRTETASQSFEDLASIREQILTAAKEAEESGRHDSIEVLLPPGKYTIHEPFVLSAEENPELSSVDITIKSAYAGNTEINSLVRLDNAKLTLDPSGKYYTFRLDKDANGKYPRFREFLLNFRRIPMSKSPSFYNYAPLTPEERSGEVKREGLYCPLEIAEKLVSDEIGATELVMYIEWVYAVLRVDSVDFDNRREIGGKTHVLIKFKDNDMDKLCTACVPHLNIGNREMFFRNSPAFIETDTFAYDWNTGKIYVDPHNREYAIYHAYEYPTLEVLFRFDGLKNLTLDGVGFAGSATKYPCDHMIYTGQANIVRIFEGEETVTHVGRLKNAAVLASNMRNFTVKNCPFRDLGGYGVQIIDRSVSTKIEGCSFRYVSMSAISVGNPTSAWQNEVNRTHNLRIENNRFSHIAHDYPACPCIYVAQVDTLKLLHNTVDGCAYSAVSVGWVWRPAEFAIGEKVNIRNAEIAYNYFHNFMECLKDGGAIYVLGGNADPEHHPDRFNCMHDNFALLDTLVEKYGKYGYYCDGSASNWDVSHSVVINVSGMPIFSQPHPNASSYHNHFSEIYSNTPPHQSTVVPSRDIVTEKYYLVRGDANALLEAYPEAVKIRDAAGCNADIV